MKRIGLLTSGGDCPGMNACIRSVVRTAIYKGLEVYGIFKGYQGLIEGQVKALDRRSVSNILTHGGTMLKTARSPEFKTAAGQNKAKRVIEQNGLEGLVVIGGDGSFRGAHRLWQRWKFPVIGVPATIDNDINGTDATIGADTAVDTALYAIDKIRDTVTSLERIFVIEVMGRGSGYIALEVGLAGGAEDIIIPERRYNIDKMCADIRTGHKKGKISWIIVVAEGAASAADVAAKITRKTHLETRVSVLGHIQRGGSPSADDRILATHLGAEAVKCLIRGERDKMVGMVNNRVKTVDLSYAVKKKKINTEVLYRLIRILAL
ncbi:MAG: 6-phosphofructokinase [Candidatus Omnitrophota bacterium]|nr:MAG: 6-phosphofructokinase [Candidatus Omnitrophota bacterium]